MKTAYLIAGLLYGDEGKGATVDFLCRQKDVGLVVRYNGGAQAGHNVITPDGKHHEFAQFGSGTFVPGCRTFLSKYMLVDPLAMVREELHLRQLGVVDAFRHTFVDPKALVITPYQRAVNRLKQSTTGKHNSCGRGIGETRADHLKYGESVLFVEDLYSHKLKEKLEFLREVNLKKLEGLEAVGLAEVFANNNLHAWYEPFIRRGPYITESLAALMHSAVDVVFEGAQGVLLDEKHGEEGFNTWSNTTFENAYELLKEHRWEGEIIKIGVMRTYLTRHGDGPHSTEKAVNFSSIDITELHKEEDGPQGKFRVGLMDFNLLDKSLKICGGVDWLALNHFDQWPQRSAVLGGRDELWEKACLASLALVTKAPVGIVGTGVTADDRHFTEEWIAKEAQVIGA